MHLYLFALGAVVLAVTLLDVVSTTLSPGTGTGPLTGPLNRGLWRAAHRVVPRGRDRVLVWVGPALLVLTLFVWVVLLITGWTLVFSADASSLMHTRTSPPTPSDLTGRIWFVTYTMFTVGNGDYSPNGDAYQMTASVLTITGMALATGGITYAVSLASAVGQARSLASSVFSLGETGPGMVARCWTGVDVGRLGPQLATYTTQLSAITEKYRDYPIMHYYHPPRPSLSVPRAVCALDDLLLTVATLPPEIRPAAADTVALDSSIGTFLEMATTGLALDPRPLPGLPDLQPLTDAGVPAPRGGPLAELSGDRRARRQLLNGLCDANGWGWPAG